MTDRYSRQVARIAVAQMAETAGFDGVQESAVEVLADLMLRYVAQLASASHAYAEVAGRTDCNINDVLLAFEDTGVSLDSLKAYAGTGEEVPFAHPLPSYPVSKKPNLAPTFLQKKETPPPHVPAFLPAFPDKHTYMRTAAFSGHPQGAREQRLAADEARRQAEKSLVKLHDRSMPPPPPPKHPSLGKAPPPKGPSSMGPPAARPKHSNPFLAAPTWEDTPRPAMQAAEAAAAPDISLLEQGAQFGDEDEDDEAAPMEGLADAFPDNAGQWLEWRADEAKDQSAEPFRAQLGIPFMLDMAANMRHKAVSGRLQRDVEDAFGAVSDDDQDAAAVPGRLKPNQKHRRAQQRDPGLAQAEQILEAGSNAMGMHQEQR